MGAAHLVSGVLGVSESPRHIATQWPAAEVPACPAAFGAGYGRGRSTYVRRRPEDTVLHRVVREHLETFLAEARLRGGGEGSGEPRLERGHQYLYFRLDSEELAG